MWRLLACLQATVEWWFHWGMARVDRDTDSEPRDMCLRVWAVGLWISEAIAFKCRHLALAAVLDGATEIKAPDSWTLKTSGPFKRNHT